MSVNKVYFVRKMRS